MAKGRTAKTSGKGKSLAPATSSEIASAPAAFAELAKRDKSLSVVRARGTIKRVKIVTGSAEAELKEKFDVGDVIIPGVDIVIAPVVEKELGASFQFTPIFAFLTWETWSDYNDKSSPAVLASEAIPGRIAALARNAGTRTEKYKGGDGSEYEMNHVEALNFIIAIDGHDIEDLHPILTFARGESYTGDLFSDQLKKRKVATDEGDMTVPIFTTRWRATVTRRKNAKHDWLGFEMTDGDPPYIDTDLADKFEQLHDRFDKERESLAAAIRADGNEGEGDD